MTFITLGLISWQQQSSVSLLRQFLWISMKTQATEHCPKCLEVLPLRSNEGYVMNNAWVLIESKLKQSWGQTVVGIDTESVRVSLARKTDWGRAGDVKEKKEKSESIILKLNSERESVWVSTRARETEPWQSEGREFRPLFPDNGHSFPGLTHGLNLLHSQLMPTTWARCCMFLWWEIACKEFVLLLFHNPSLTSGANFLKMTGQQI